MPYIYALKDKDGSVRYVGKANDPDKRLKSHMRDSIRRDTPVYRWIRKNGKPDMDVLTGDIDDWQEAERRIIAEYKSAGHKLLNVAEGGDEPFCPREVRVENGRKMNLINGREDKKRLNSLKRRMSRHINKYGISNAVKSKLGYCFLKRPDLFGLWAEYAEYYKGDVHGAA